MTGKYGRTFRKSVVKTQKQLLAYKKSHRLSARARHNMDQAIDVLAQARYSHIGPEQNIINAKAQKVLDFIAEQDIQGVALGEGVTGL